MEGKFKNFKNQHKKNHDKSITAEIDSIYKELETMNREKENALKNYIAMIKNSWTWHKMTEKEQTALLDYLYDDINRYDRLKGTYSTRWETLHMIYDAYLLGIGYNGPSWREEPNT